jgi:hypothetical protein
MYLWRKKLCENALRYPCTKKNVRITTIGMMSYQSGLKLLPEYVMGNTPLTTLLVTKQFRASQEE